MAFKEIKDHRKKLKEREMQSQDFNKKLIHLKKKIINVTLHTLLSYSPFLSVQKRSNMSGKKFRFQSNFKRITVYNQTTVDRNATEIAEAKKGHINLVE